MRADLLDHLLALDADINAVSASGNTPLTQTIAAHSVWAAQALLFRGADPHRPNANGQSPYTLATEALEAARSAKTQDAIAALEVIAYLVGTAAALSTNSPQAIATLQLFFAVFTVDAQALPTHLANGADVNAHGSAATPP